MSTSTSKAKKQNKAPQKSTTNINDVFIKALDVFYDLANSGKIFALIFLVVAIVFIVLAFRMPTENIDGYLKEILLFFKSAAYPLTLSWLLLLFSISINFVQWRIYGAEITRLTELRKGLIHGLQQGEIKKLEDHNSSEFDVQDDP